MNSTSRSSKQKKSKNTSIMKNDENKNEKLPFENSDEISFGLDSIFKKKFKVFRISPLYNFSDKKLKSYEKKLCSELSSVGKRNSNITYNCSFMENKNFQVNDQLFKALQLKISENQSKILYLSYFLSPTSSNSEIHGENFISFLLVRAKSRLACDVHSILGKMFDCDIQPMNFSFLALIGFLVRLLEDPTKSLNNSQELLLEYKIPGCKPKDRIKVVLMLKDTIVIFAIIIENLREKVNGITTKKLMMEFYKRLLNHIYNIYKLDLMQAELCKVMFPYAFITNDGQFMISTENAAEIVFGILHHFTSLNPQLGIQSAVYQFD